MLSYAPNVRSGSRSRSVSRSGDRGLAAGTTRSRVLELQRLAGNRAVTEALLTAQREEDPDATGTATGAGAGAAAGATATKPPPQKVTGFLGLNPKAGKEAEALRKASPSTVEVSLNNPEAEKKYRENREIFDFVVDELGIGLDQFDRWDKATDVLMKADVHLREQLADVMRWFNSAEKGESILERLVLSGHSNGVEIWGESTRGAESKPGTMLVERDLGNIAAVFPTAAGQVEDIMFSACFSINAVEIVIRIFPNLKTCWGYGGFSPDIAQGSPGEIAAWARATEGGGALKRNMKHGNVALWVRGEGYIVGDPAAAAAGPLYSEALRMWREIAQPMYDGSGGDLSNSALVPVYTKVQQMMSHPGTPADRRERAQHVMGLVLRLRHWPQIRERFGAEYGPKLQPLYDALKVSAPAWKSLTRKELKAHVDAMKEALKNDAAASPFKELVEHHLEKGILMLDEKIITPDWI